MALLDRKYSFSKSFSAGGSSTSPGPEPMVMGSPSSPPSASLGTSHSQYLPGYLLGDQNPSLHHSSLIQSPSSSSRLWPGQTLNSPATKSATLSGSLLQSPQGFGSAKRFSDRNDELPAIRSKDKFTAPPVSGLLDTSVSSSTQLGSAVSHNIPPHHQTALDGAHTLVSGFSSPIPSSSYTSGPVVCSQSTPAMMLGGDAAGSSLNQINQCSPTQMDPFYTQGEELSPSDVLDETWVTVFGFPKGAAGYILQQFSEYGTVIEHLISNEGNWMHLHYQSRISAKKALNKAAMRGEVPDNCTKEENISLHSVSHTIPLRVSSKELIDAGAHSSYKGTPIRPLTRAYDSNSTSSSEGDRSQQDGSSWWKKAMEYAFGW